MRAVASAEVVVKGFSTTTGDWKGILGLFVLRGAERSQRSQDIPCLPLRMAFSANSAWLSELVQTITSSMSGSAKKVSAVR
jgi:hypothetical protein